MADDLSTTGYAILGFLGVRPFSAYELTTQVQRSLRWFWPRSGNMLYDVPKRLVSLGLARGKERSTGRRRRTVYAITAPGRRAVRGWLDRPCQPPALEFEALVRVLFAEQGTKEQLLRTLAEVREHSLDMLAFGRAIGREYREAGGPFPERLHVNALIFDFMWRHAEAMRSWAEWAIEEVERWDAMSHQPGRQRHLLAHYAKITAEMELRLAARDELARSSTGVSPVSGG
jgi:DNA-binding PadR family transcriptional regulator